MEPLARLAYLENKEKGKSKIKLRRAQEVCGYNLSWKFNQMKRKGHLNGVKLKLQTHVPFFSSAFSSTKRCKTKTSENIPREENQTREETLPVQNYNSRNLENEAKTEQITDHSTIQWYNILPTDISKNEDKTKPRNPKGQNFSREIKIPESLEKYLGGFILLTNLEYSSSIIFVFQINRKYPSNSIPQDRRVLKNNRQSYTSQYIILRKIL